MVLSADDVTKHKPDPEGIEKCISELDGIKAQTVILGDSKSDLGVDSILNYPDSHNVFYDIGHLKTYKPTHIFKSFSEIKNLFT